jgi:hypothetical protein
MWYSPRSGKSMICRRLFWDSKEPMELTEWLSSKGLLSAPPAAPRSRPKYHMYNCSFSYVLSGRRQMLDSLVEVTRDDAVLVRDRADGGGRMTGLSSDARDKEVMLSLNLSPLRGPVISVDCDVPRPIPRPV